MVVLALCWNASYCGRVLESQAFRDVIVVRIRLAVTWCSFVSSARRWMQCNLSFEGSCWVQLAVCQWVAVVSWCCSGLRI